MRFKIIILLLFCYLLTEASAEQSNQPRQSDSIVFTHLTVIDATGAPPRTDVTVVIVGNRITDIGKSEEVHIPNDSQVVDGRDKFLIPGLWDMHTHPFLMPDMLEPAQLFNMYLANGITGIRDPSGPLELQLKWRSAIQRAEVSGPRMFVSGPVIDGPNPIWPSFAVAVANPTDARVAVSLLKKQGADFIKVYDFLPRDAYFALAAEARKEKIPFAGHIPVSVTAAEASDAGQRSIEHVLHLFESCSSLEYELQRESLKQISQASAKGMEANLLPLLRELFRIEVKAAKTYDEKKAQALFARFVKNNTYVDPTLAGYRYERGDFDTADPRLKFVPAFLKATWMPGNYLLSRAYIPEDFTEAKLLYRKRIDLIGRMHRAGVKLLAGTDSPTVAYSFAGFSLHDELALLVEAGLTPMEALQAATRNPAEFFGLLSSLGTIERGKIADLVLLDANPLDDIRNTRKIDAVVVGGKLLSKQKLQMMLDDAESKASRK